MLNTHKTIEIYFKFIGIKISKILIICIGITITILVAKKPIVDEGLNILFLLPASLTIAIILFNKVFKYFFDSIGLAILYALLLLRYYITPLLTAMSGYTVFKSEISLQGYRYAIILMIIELFTILLTIKIIWKKKYKKEVIKNNYFKLHWTGFLTLIVLVSILLLRGKLNNVFSHLSFFSSISVSYENLYTYDMQAFLTIKSFIFILIASWAGSRYQINKNKIKRIIYFTIVVLAAFINAMIYDFSNRGTMVQIATSTIIVLYYYFSKKIKKVLPFVIIFGIWFVWYVFSFGTLANTVDNPFFQKADYLSGLAHVAELYSNGVSTMAYAYDIRNFVYENMTLLSYFSDFVNSLSFITLPGFWIIHRIFKEIPSTLSLFGSTLNGRAYILPSAGIALYYGGLIFGVLVDIIFHILFIKMIYYFYKKRKTTNSIAYLYLYSYCEMICGFAIMNSIFLIIGWLTDLPLLLYCIIKINSFGKNIKYFKYTSIESLNY